MTERSPRRVALVAYFYPPVGGVAVARTLGFVRHLPEAGWDPVVIAPSGSTYPLRDEQQVADTRRDVEVHRCLSPEPGHVARAVRGGIGWARTVLRPPAPMAPAPAPASAEPSSSTVAGISGLTARLGPWPGRLRRLVWFPDDQAGWLPFAVGALVAAHRREPLDAIVSSASPMTAHLVGWVGSRLVGVPWVADFRDPWADNPVDPQTGFARWRQITLEGAAVRMASHCTFATPGLRDLYARRYPRLASRFSVLPNGYEREVGAATPRATVGASQGTPTASGPEHGTVRLVYAGSLYRPPELDTFLAGVAAFALASPDAAGRLEVTFLGTASEACRAVADRWRADDRVGAIVHYRDYVPRAEAIATIASADAALTLLGEGPGMGLFVGAKLYDYLALDKQVLAMLPPGDARTVLAELDWGIVADPRPDAVAAALTRLLDEPRPTRRADPEGRYDRARIALQLGGLLDDLVRRAKPVTPPDGTGAAQ